MIKTGVASSSAASWIMQSRDHRSSASVPVVSDLENVRHIPVPTFPARTSVLAALPSAQAGTPSLGSGWNAPIRINP